MEMAIGLGGALCKVEREYREVWRKNAGLLGIKSNQYKCSYRQQYFYKPDCSYSIREK